ncbi:MAG: hypothetical protein KF703_08385 [Actinobacteria bacterium]|nr:hypothetical protein [Actinomycetota bacterium]
MEAAAHSAVERCPRLAVLLGRWRIAGDTEFASQFGGDELEEGLGEAFEGEGLAVADSQAHGDEEGLDGEGPRRPSRSVALLVLPLGDRLDHTGGPDEPDRVPNGGIVDRDGVAFGSVEIHLADRFAGRTNRRRLDRVQGGPGSRSTDRA